MSTLSVIVALADNLAIGKDGDLLWHLPNDMKRFRELTTGNSIVMGRKTFDSLPKGALPNRKNIVLTKQANAGIPGAYTVNSLQKAIEAADSEEVFIIGGAMIYELALPFADKMYLTFVHHHFDDADTFFPPIDFIEWEETERTVYPADERHAYPYTFATYIRKK